MAPETGTCPRGYCQGSAPSRGVELAELVMEGKTTSYVMPSTAFLPSVVRAAVGSILRV